MIGLKLQGGPIGVDGAIKLPERLERLGEGGVISRLGGADRDRPAHKRGRPTGISPLTTIVCGKPRGRSPRGTWRRWSTTWAGSHAVKRSSISWTRPSGFAGGRGH